jgi:hypothetical protein
MDDADQDHKIGPPQATSAWRSCFFQDIAILPGTKTALALESTISGTVRKIFAKERGFEKCSLPAVWPMKTG